MTRLERLIKKYVEISKTHELVTVHQVINDLWNLKPVPREPRRKEKKA